MVKPDCVLQDWQTAGLRRLSAFRAFLATLPTASLTMIGHLSEQDWRKVQGCLRVALAVT